jgi:peptide/nickel transport system substrate-binding protein
MTRISRAGGFLAMLLVVVGCSPTTSPAPSASSGGQPSAAPPSASAAASAAAQSAAASAAASAAVESPSASTAAIPTGGTITYVTESPGSLIGVMSNGPGESWIAQLTTRGLADYDKDGNWKPLLATDIPTVANGGVSADGLTITWKLKPNLKWSDGTPITSDDVKFTWEVCSDPASSCVKTAGIVDITALDTPDPQTVVLHYKRLFFGYKGQFRWGILPRHSKDVGAPADLKKWAYNTTLNPSSGPFMVKSFDQEQSISLVRNPNFYDAPKPYLDGINAVFRSDNEVFRQMVISGQADLAPSVKRDPDLLADLHSRGFTIGTGSSPYQGRFSLNPRDPSDLTKPHPILGDPNVRKAILMGSDVDKVTYTWNFPGIYTPTRYTSRWDLWGPEYACGLPPIQFDQAGAKALLDSAGWTVGANGIRGKSGVPMKLRVTVYSGYGEEDNQVVWLDELKQLGIDAVADNVDAGILYGNWKDGNPAATGKYDLIYWEQGKDLGDPQTEAEQYYLSKNIPSEKNPSGWNFAGINDPEIDNWVTTAGGTLDQTVRQANLCKVADKVTNTNYAEEWFGILPSFKYSQPKLKGWHDAEQYTYFGQDSEDWYLEP